MKLKPTDTVEGDRALVAPFLLKRPVNKDLLAAVESRTDTRTIVAPNGRPAREVIEIINDNVQEVLSPVEVSSISEVDTAVLANIETLAQLSTNFISPSKIETALQQLGTALGKTITLPESEIQRMNTLFSHMMPQERIAEVVNGMKEVTEGNTDPLIIAFPEKIRIDGQELPFSIATLQSILLNKTGNFKGVWTDNDYVTEAQKARTFPTTLRAYTSSCLTNSKNTKYSDQIDLQKTIAAQLLLRDFEVHEDFFLAVILHHLNNPHKDSLLLSDIMRLNPVGSDGVRFFVGSDDSKVGLASANLDVSPRSGIGLSSTLLS